MFIASSKSSVNNHVLSHFRQKHRECILHLAVILSLVEHSLFRRHDTATFYEIMTTVHWNSVNFYNFPIYLCILVWYNFYSAPVPPGWGVEYCDEWVCPSFCQHTCAHTQLLSWSKEQMMLMHFNAFELLKIHVKIYHEHQLCYITFTGKYVTMTRCYIWLLQQS